MTAGPENFEYSEHLLEREDFLEALERMSKEELLRLGNLVDTLVIEKELQSRRSTPAR